MKGSRLWQATLYSSYWELQCPKLPSSSASETFSKVYQKRWELFCSVLCPPGPQGWWSHLLGPLAWRYCPLSSGQQSCPPETKGETTLSCGPISSASMVVVAPYWSLHHLLGHSSLFFKDNVCSQPDSSVVLSFLFWQFSFISFPLYSLVQAGGISTGITPCLFFSSAEIAYWIQPYMSHIWFTNMTHTCKSHPLSLYQMTVQSHLWCSLQNTVFHFFQYG